MTKKKKKKKELASGVCEELKKIYPESVCALEYEGEPWRLLVMARLSAQCTDARVNIVSRTLFERFPTLEAMAEGELSEIEEIVRPCGLFRTKAASIKEACISIRDDFGGRVPDTMDELLSLSGVGRKIANLILGDIYGKGGIVADTHCIRICGRLGFYPEEQKDPLKTERIMSELLPAEEQSDFCHRIVQFGRDFCSARSPKCGECPLSHLCPKGENPQKITERFV
ncbi:MAG: endonuclease III [Ruminococcaceae bacterium]|nr:endonuclease III [Oscillospiraceae bacterium]